MVASAIREGLCQPRTAAQMDGLPDLPGTYRLPGGSSCKQLVAFGPDVFSQRMTTWSDGECFEFARLLKKFTEPPATTQGNAIKKHS